MRLPLALPSAALTLTLLIAAMALASCGEDTPVAPAGDGGASDGGATAPDAGQRDAAQGAPDAATATLDVAPASAETFVGAAPTTITATLTGSSAALAWSLDGPGTLSTTTGGTTTYLPPHSGPIGVATVTATAGSVTASARIVVTSAPQRAIVAYAWAHDPTTVSYEPSGYSYNAAGGAITATRSATGVYQMSFAGSNLAGGTVDVTAYGTSARCRVDDWGATTVSVTCTDGAGAPVDSRYVVRVTQPDVPSDAAVVAFAHADQPATVSYTPSSNTSYSAYAGAISATRNATGIYRMAFGGADLQDGNVQVTATGSDRTCNVLGWNAGDIDVGCYDQAGNPAESGYVVSAVQRGVFTRTSVAAYAWANDPTAASYTPNAPYAYNASRQAIRASRSAAGTYAMSFDGLDLAHASVKVTARGTAQQCNVASWTGSTIGVRCYDGAGALADSPYTVSVAMANQPVTTRVIAYAWASGLTSASYAAFPAYARNPYGAITLTRSAPGMYAATFAGIPPGPSSVMVSGYGGNRHCGVIDYVGETVSIACLSPEGTLADSLYTVAIVGNDTHSTASIAATAVADQPTQASYAPTNAFNSTNGAVTLTRSTAGAYRAEFAGLTIESGDVQVSALEEARDCTILSWGESRVDVRCFDRGGAPADARFSVVVVLDRFGTPSANIVAYAAATEPSAASYAVAAPLAYDASGGAVTATRSATGRYAITFAGLELGRATAKVTAAGNAGATCVVLRVEGDRVDVSCTNSAGAGIDSMYAVTLTM